MSILTDKQAYAEAVEGALLGYQQCAFCLRWLDPKFLRPVNPKNPWNISHHSTKMSCIRERLSECDMVTWVRALAAQEIALERTSAPPTTDPA